MGSHNYLALTFGILGNTYKGLYRLPQFSFIIFFLFFFQFFHVLVLQYRSFYFKVSSRKCIRCLILVLAFPLVHISFFYFTIVISRVYSKSHYFHEQLLSFISSQLIYIYILLFGPFNCCFLITIFITLKSNEWPEPVHCCLSQL